MSIYTVKNIFYTLQGEGMNVGMPAVFVRFTGCNLWTGRDEDRATAECSFCDTDFIGGKKYTTSELVDAVKAFKCPLVVFTGGEPALQLDNTILTPLRHMRRAIETNGTLTIPSEVDWICVSPKAGTAIKTRYADELKLVYPQEGLTPEEAAAAVVARHKWLSPMDGPNWRENVTAAMAYVKANPSWRVNIQAHKFWRIP
jgi:7-carboxy-7-deazaguanine synthase